MRCEELPTPLLLKDQPQSTRLHGGSDTLWHRNINEPVWQSLFRLFSAIDSPTVSLCNIGVTVQNEAAWR